jgi:hypothetical protein
VHGTEISDQTAEQGTAASAPAVAQPAHVDIAAVDAPTAEPAPTAQAAARPPEPQKAAEPVLVALQITTSPRDAQLLLDGAPVPNPFDARLPKGGSHHVQAAAPGYEGSGLTIELTRERRVALTLEPQRATASGVTTQAADPAPKRRTAPRRARAPKPPAEEPKKGAGFVAESPY